MTEQSFEGVLAMDGSSTLARCGCLTSNRCTRTDVWCASAASGIGSRGRLYGRADESVRARQR